MSFKLISKYVSYSLLLFTPYGSGSENPRLKKDNQKAFSIKQKLSIILLSSVIYSIFVP